MVVHYINHIAGRAGFTLNGKRYDEYFGYDYKNYVSFVYVDGKRYVLEEGGN